MSDFIKKLSSQIGEVKPLNHPIKITLKLLSILLIYGILLQKILGLRPDLSTQFLRPLFVIEMVIIFLLFISSLISTVLTMYPDTYQKSKLLKIPYIFFLLLLVVFLIEFLIPHNDLMSIPLVSHTIECTICILELSIIPSILLFIILKKGATTIPTKSGLFITLTASSLGYLILRLHEMNDSISHLLIWHYFPILIFSFIGSIIGRYLLKW